MAENRQLQYGTLLILLLVAVPYQAWSSFVQVAPLLGGDKPHHAQDYIQLLVLKVAMPLFCLALGFWVAAVRPADRLAWIVLFLLLSFSQISGQPPLKRIDIRALREIAIVYHQFMVSSWPLWMLLFGIYFPERIAYDRRWPALKWLLIAPLIAVISANILVAMPALETRSFVQSLRQLVERYRAVLAIVGMVAIGTFFANLHAKLSMSSSADARRRLRLMLVGMHVSMTPTFALVIWALSRGRGFFEGISPGILLPSLLLLCLFPVTMAYVIVVQRAMDVRVALRQGVQYAFARGGLVGLRVLISAAIVAAMMLLSSRPNTPRWQVFAIFAAGVFLMSVMGRLARLLAVWIDRRFFREAYNAEKILTELSERVRTIVQAQPLLETISRNIADSLHVERIATLLVDGSGYRMAYAIGYPVAPNVGFGLEDATVEHLRRVQKPARVYFDDESSWLQGPSGPGKEERARIRSLETHLLLPLSVQDKLLGIIALGPKQSEQPYTNSDLRLLHSVATQAGLALENTQLTAQVATEVAQRERVNRELEIAREVQERLFPQSLPEVSGLDYSGACRPALGVGGDYYDFLALPGGKLGIAIGDVSGKGVAAALLMASLQASLRGQTMGGPRQLADLMSNVNRLVYEASGSNRYATFFYAQYESATRELTFVNAGHNPPVVLRGSGEDRQVLRLKAGGTVVGLLPAYAYQQDTIKLQPGDTIVAFTDGISEAMNGSEEEWGEERMIEAAWSCRDKPAADVIVQLMIGADAFAAGAAQHDDMTLVVAQIV